MSQQCLSLSNYTLVPGMERSKEQNIDGQFLEAYVKKSKKWLLY
jgi:hypothetical protein